MIVLGIETSCDETAAALVRDGQDVLGNAVASQIKLHAGYGGVVPELAAREHLRAMDVVVNEALTGAGLAVSDVDAVAVTCGPGLIPALLVGTSYAKGLAAARGCPFLGVNHFLAHIYGSFIGRPDVLADANAFPVLALVASGGHSALVVIASSGRAHIVGTTIDDAAGEAYDKAAKILGLGYPGGPILDRIAKTGNPKAYDFPRGLTAGSGKPLDPMQRYNFSFSGVKTALLYATKGKELDEQGLADVVASYQQAIVDVLVAKTIRAASEFGTPTICLCGGVACNSQLRASMGEAVTRAERQLVLAAPKYCTDNAAMVGGIAFHYLSRGITSELGLSVSARLEQDLGTIPFAPRAR